METDLDSLPRRAVLTQVAPLAHPIALRVGCLSARVPSDLALPSGEGLEAWVKTMVEFRERRRVPRTPIAGDLSDRARSTLDVRLLDLSTFGARIEHLDLLRPGSACTFELPPSIGTLTLSARIIHSSVVGAAPTREGERRLCYQSGLVFTGITVDQQTTLESALQKLTSRGSSRNTRFSM